MNPISQCGQYRAENVNLAGSQFHRVNLAGADFDDVNLSKTRFHNINLSDIDVSAVQIGGARFSCIGPPPDQDGHQARQRPVTFQNAMLCDSVFRKVDFSGAALIDCNVEGLTIDGVLVTDLLAAYRLKAG